MVVRGKAYHLQVDACCFSVSLQNHVDHHVVLRLFFFFWKIFSRNYISVMITCSALALAVDLY